MFPSRYSTDQHKLVCRYRPKQKSFLKDAQAYQCYVLSFCIPQQFPSRIILRHLLKNVSQALVDGHGAACENKQKESREKIVFSAAEAIFKLRRAARKEYLEKMHRFLSSFGLSLKDCKKNCGISIAVKVL